MLRMIALAGCVLVGAQLLGCDVQVSRGAGGQNAGPITGVPAASGFQQVRQGAVGVKLKSDLIMARNACEMYQADYGQYPDFAAQGWSALTREGFLPRAPVNPHSPRSVATKIIVTDEPGLTGADVDPSRAGWVFNTSSGWGGRMYAAGVSD